MKQKIWLSDLTKFEPVNALSSDRREGMWITVDYEVDEGQRSNAVRVAVLKFATIDFVVGGDRLA